MKDRERENEDGEETYIRGKREDCLEKVIYYEIKGKEGEAKLRGSNDAKGREMKDGRREKMRMGKKLILVSS